ncbi:hypothetical protein Btru_070919 [Bulinus truncatus]|nr:hypothetical protein Btru_070919 [Bulinus truncatus]
MAAALNDCGRSSEKEDSSESTEWQQPQHQWSPTSDKDKWRAFEPSTEVSMTKWWEQKLDDNLWDPKPVLEEEILDKGKQVKVEVDRTPKPDQPVTTKSEVTAKPADVVNSQADTTVTQKPEASTSTSKPESVTEKLATTPEKIPPSDATPQAVTLKPTTAKSNSFESGFYRKAELNTFVEPDLGAYYRPSNSLSWDSAYASSYDSSDSKELTPKSSTEQKPEPSSKEEVKSADALETVIETTTKFSQQKSTEKSSAQPTLTVPVNSSPADGAVEENKVTQPAGVSKNEDAAVEPSVEESNSIYGKGESIGAPALGNMNKDTEKVAIVQNKQKNLTKSDSDFVDWADWDNSLFEGYEDDEEDEAEAKGDNAVKESKVGEIKKVVETKILEEKKLTKEIEKPQEKLKLEEKKTAEIKKTPAVRNPTAEETDIEDAEDLDDDDNDIDDEYYDDWEDDWDEDVKPEGEGKGPSIVATTASPAAKEKKEKKSKKMKSEKKSKNTVSLDTVAQQASKLVNKVDLSHYSKGIIYDSDVPSHKPSVKKDLSQPEVNLTQKEPVDSLVSDEHTDKNDVTPTPPGKNVIAPTEKKVMVQAEVSDKGIHSKPASSEEENKDIGQLEGDENVSVKKENIILKKETADLVADKGSISQKSVINEDDMEHNLPKTSVDKEIKKEFLTSPKSLNSADPVPLKKEQSVTFFHASHMNTESDASTSPNPPPPGLATDKVSLSGGSSNTTPGPKGPQLIKAESSDDYIVSYPLEFCQMDFECRAGRMCVKGVCKCVTPSACAGHHKPICGSDGVRYASHCEMHRTACVNRVHIRVDRKGNCFQKELKSQIANKEKGWLLEQKKSPQSVHIPSQEIYNFPEDIKKGPETSDVKKSLVPKDKEGGEHQVKVTSAPAITKKECTWEEMAQFKETLLMYYCQKFVEPNCKMEAKTDRSYLSMLMFSYLDQNFDYSLTASELDDKERDEHFEKKIIANCHLHDFVKFADTVDTNGKLTVSEFTQAFELSVPTASVHAKVEVISTLASAGNGLELKCGIDAATNVIWKRYGTQLNDDKHGHQMMVFEDGALFFSKVGLHHIGNYTCMNAEDESNQQVHRLRVQTLPVMTVNPVTQTHMTGSDVELKCHAEGVPKPVVAWKQGGEVVNSSAHVTQYFGGGHIVIHNAQTETDSGTFTCSAHNQAGSTEKTVSVSVVPPTDPAYKSNMKEAGTFMVFNAQGIQSYDPLHCLLKHQVHGNFGNFKFIPDVLDGPLTLCRSGQDCEWGSAIRVGSEFIYASQPDQNRVVIVETGSSWSPIQVIDTDKRPTKLWYVKHLDQVWVLCADQQDSQGGKTIVVIRDASQQIQHRAVHTRPVGNHFDTVQDLFIAKPNDLEHEFDFGYVTHHDQNGLFKLNLEDMSYTKSIDLSSYGCVPTYLDFVPIGGHVLIQCVSSADHHTLQLTMDYLTDTVISTVSLPGRPMTSPDSRHLVTVDESTGKVTVSSVSDEGKYLYGVTFITHLPVLQSIYLFYGSNIVNLISVAQIMGLIPYVLSSHSFRGET